MNINKLFAVLLLSAVWIAGCSQSVGYQIEDVVKITDAIGREIEIPEKVERIVCIGPGALRLITYLQATDKVVGVEGGFEKDSSAGRPYIMAHQELTQITTIGVAAPSPQLNPEAILNVEPDVVFICYVEPRIANNLQDKIGIPVVILSYGDLATFDNEYVFNSLKIAGKILNKIDRAEAVINFIKDSQQDLIDRTKEITDEEKPRVYVGGLGFKGTHGITSTECRYPAFEILNARNVVNEVDRQGHIFVDKEKLLEWNPDAIFVDGGGMSRIKEDYRKNPEFYNLLKAVQKEQIYGLFPYNFYTTNIDTALANAYYIGKVLYPEKFKDVEPQKKADEIYKFLVGKPVYEDMANDWEGFRKFEFKQETE